MKITAHEAQETHDIPENLLIHINTGQ